MWAVLSDIHGNLEALDAVLADIAKHPVSQIFCLGDLVGYGPNPIECIEKAMAWDVVLLGNHDYALMFDTEGFALNAEKSIFWSRKVVESAHQVDHWTFIAACPRTRKVGDFLLVHGSARNPLNEYVFPEDIYNEPKMTRIGSLIERYCLAGHTHVPGVFIDSEGVVEHWTYRAPAEMHGFYHCDGRKTIINVGSVGQPRDNDWRACYALVDGWDISFRRVEYDVDATVAKIHAIPELDNFLGDRLREGV